MEDPVHKTIIIINVIIKIVTAIVIASGNALWNHNWFSTEYGDNTQHQYAEKRFHVVILLKVIGEFEIDLLLLIHHHLQ